jgi:hypothetical protein
MERESPRTHRAPPGKILSEGETIMKSRIVKLVIVVTLVSMLDTAGGISLLPAGEAMAANPAMPADSKSRRLEGTWQVQVTLQNCQTSATIRTAPAFLTFAQGGTLVETTAVFSSAQRSPGHGFWEHTGGKTFKAVSKAFFFNPDGALAGTQTITQQIEFDEDPDVFNSNATTEIVAPNGSVILSGCATAIAHRME